jgi:hypothetical protein
MIYSRKKVKIATLDKYITITSRLLFIQFFHTLSSLIDYKYRFRLIW